MRRYFRNLTLRTIWHLWRKLYPTPQHIPETATEAWLKQRLDALVGELGDPEKVARRNYAERCHELAEARQMMGSGPWLPEVARDIPNSGARIATQLRESTTIGKLIEATPFLAQGSTGDIELALQNVAWRREVNFSLIEFSRWGITQIILICRLYWLKNPIVRRLIDVGAVYVFGLGFEISSPDDKLNGLIQAFLKRNAKSIGQVALTELHRAKWTDGNIFWVLSTDSADTGEVDLRTIDPLEVMDIISDPEDPNVPWYYRRSWSSRIVDMATGNTTNVPQEAYYPALGYDPANRPETIGALKVHWDHPIYHRKCGSVKGWKFGCPLAYPMTDWSKEARRYLEACASNAQARAQFALTITTKGGQQALEGIKQQNQTTVGPATPIWDTNPPAVAGATFASGPGTKVESFDQGGGLDPEGVRQYKLMCCMVRGVPETFLADVSTGNLATATTLDRPTELVFKSEQEEWREDLVILTIAAMMASKGAPSGKLREAYGAERAKGIRIVEMSRRRMANGDWVYEASKTLPADTFEVKCSFPAIREGDQKDLMESLVMAATLGNKGGQFIGIDEKQFVTRAYELAGFDNGTELAEQQYPTKEYDMDRTKEILPPPVAKVKPAPGGQPQIAANQPQPDQGDAPPITAKKVESLMTALGRVKESLEPLEVKVNGRS